MVGNWVLALFDVRSRLFVRVLVPGTVDGSGKADGAISAGGAGSRFVPERLSCVTFARDSQPPDPEGRNTQNKVMLSHVNPPLHALKQPTCTHPSLPQSTLTPTKPQILIQKRASPSHPPPTKSPPEPRGLALYFYRPRHPGRLIGASQTPKAGCRPIRC